jgi:predicted ATP-grasp superfamily ATP-dependent carboligase
MSADTRPPALILGGSANALSVARSLGRRGVRVHASVVAGHHALYSRYCTGSLPMPPDRRPRDVWGDLLFGPAGKALRGSVILTCNDDAVEFVARHRESLRRHFVVDESVPSVQLAMLDKLQTLELACRHGVAIPRFWPISADAMPDLPSDLLYPVIVKPRQSHVFQKHFPGCKYLMSRDRAELVAQIEQIRALGMGAIVSEWIPGSDELLASYYTYIDASGAPLFHFTKRIIRRFPVNEGLASYHATTHDAEIAELGLRFFTSVGFRGIGMVEFKQDLRDGRWKLIECNPRFSAAQPLLTRSGLDAAWLVYCRLARLPMPAVNGYARDVRLWYPMRDYKAYQELRRRGEITFMAWARSIWHRQTLPFLDLRDPLPSLSPILSRLGIRRSIRLS